MEIAESEFSPQGQRREAAAHALRAEPPNIARSDGQVNEASSVISDFAVAHFS